ncbi:acetyltransferase [Sanguibacter keddieii DSM 10542]|uniref:Acetyltransferase n=2 Tax=Sanguibacter keddieii TaxID=60920 RepID=D1BHP0_SANKS|nr:acetyltransferase [Sanguibacter keddieii DSM 10542]
MAAQTDVMTLTTVTIAPMDGAADARAFYDLNARWITQHFALEDSDLAVMTDPETAVVAAGGAVLVAREGERCIGCVALLPHAPGVAELAKMTVDPDHRGAGVGRALITAAIDRARSMGFDRLVLESNTALVAAVRLYESVGFRHVPVDERQPSPYARADVFMDLDLTRLPVGHRPGPSVELHSH